MNIFNSPSRRQAVSLWIALSASLLDLVPAHAVSSRPGLDTEFLQHRLENADERRVAAVESDDAAMSVDRIEKVSTSCPDSRNSIGETLGDVDDILVMATYGNRPRARASGARHGGYRNYGSQEIPRQERGRNDRHFYPESGQASFYHDSLAGGRTKSGARYDPNALTAAHQHYAIGTCVRVFNRDTNRSVEVIINDNGPHIRGRVIDLSRRAAREVGMIDAGVANVDLMECHAREVAAHRRPQ